MKEEINLCKIKYTHIILKKYWVFFYTVCCSIPDIGNTSI